MRLFGLMGRYDEECIVRKYYEEGLWLRGSRRGRDWDGGVYCGL